MIAEKVEVEEDIGAMVGREEGVHKVRELAGVGLGCCWSDDWLG